MCVCVCIYLIHAEYIHQTAAFYLILLYNNFNVRHRLIPQIKIYTIIIILNLSLENIINHTMYTIESKVEKQSARVLTRIEYVVLEKVNKKNLKKE